MKSRISISRTFSSTGANPVWPIQIPVSGMIEAIDIGASATLQAAPGNGDYNGLFAISHKDPTGTSIASDANWDGVLAGVVGVIRGSGASIEQCLSMQKWASGVNYRVKANQNVYAYAAVSTSVRLIVLVTLWVSY